MRQQHGFTIIELLISITVGTMVAGMVLSLSLFLYGDVVRNDVESRMVVESQNILRTVVEDLRTASSVIESNTITDVNEPPAGWQTSNDAVVLIISSPALDTSNNFIMDESAGAPYQNETIYFEDSGVLYKRTLANPNATGNTSLTTCPAATASATCPADGKLSDNFSSMVFTFYDQDDVITTTASSARSIKVDIVLQRSAFGKDINVQNNIRVTMRNGYESI